MDFGLLPTTLLIITGFIFQLDLLWPGMNLLWKKTGAVTSIAPCWRNSTQNAVFWVECVLNYNTNPWVTAPQREEQLQLKWIILGHRRCRLTDEDMSQDKVAVIIRENENNIIYQGQAQTDNMQTALQSFTSCLQAYPLHLPKFNFPHALYGQTSSITATLRKVNAENMEALCCCQLGCSLRHRASA